MSKFIIEYPLSKVIIEYPENFVLSSLQCPIEWFHFACVQLKTKPKGKWFCPRCQEERKKK